MAPDGNVVNESSQEKIKRLERENTELRDKLGYRELEVTALRSLLCSQTSRMQGLVRYLT